ncbi:MAG: sodium:solute symporter family protein [Lentisphaeraceae bacterium]|nr:sodium:solute symporter family protein [Lentisphaeraceae bacterium]
MLGLHIADIIAILAYLCIVGGIGFWAAKKVKNLGDFVMPHKFGKFTMSMFSFGAGTHSDQAVGVASKSYSVGISGIWYQWFWLFATPFYWLIAPLMRRFRAMTTSDIFEARFDRKVSMLYTVFGILQLSVSIGVMLQGSAAIIEACTGGAFNANYAIIAMTVLFMVYGISGGLAAAIYTDLIQGVLTVIFSFILLPSIFNAVGGLSGIKESLTPELLSITMPGDISVFYIAVISFCGILGIVVQPHILGVCAAGKTEMDGRVGFVSGNFLKRICTIAWALTGLAAIVHYAGTEIKHVDQIYGIVAKEFLPGLLPGLVGLFIAALLASVMSSCDAFMISSAGLFTNNIYKNLKPGESEEHYVKVVRIAAFFVVSLGVFLAYTISDVNRGLEIFWAVTSVMGISFWMGFFWKRYNAAGAWASTISAFLIWLFLGTGFGAEFMKGLSESFVTIKEGKTVIYLPWQMLLYVVGGVIIGIITSLLTQKTDEKQLSVFYSLIHTPVSDDEALPEKGCTLPEGVESSAEKVFPLPGSLHVPIPNKLTVYGFAISWAVVFAMIAFLYWLMS